MEFCREARNSAERCRIPAHGAVNPPSGTVRRNIGAINLMHGADRSTDGAIKTKIGAANSFYGAGNSKCGPARSICCSVTGISSPQIAQSGSPKYMNSPIVGGGINATVAPLTFTTPCALVPALVLKAMP